MYRKGSMMPPNRWGIHDDHLPEGFYFLNVVSGEQVWRKKLKIRH